MNGGTDTTERCGEWLAIVNPLAGDGRAGRDWPHIGKLLKEASIRYKVLFTQRRYHAVELTVEAVNSGVRNIIVVGGTTTLHEVVNGLFIQHSAHTDEIHLGVIPVCSPEGLDGMEGIPAEYPEAIASIASGYLSLQPVATLLYHNARFRQERRALCSIRGGMNAAVLGKLLRMSEEGHRSALRKWCGAANTVLGYRRPKVHIWTDGKLALSGRIAEVLVKTVAANGGSTLAVSVAYRSHRLLSILHARRLCGGDTAAGFTQTVSGSQIKIESSPAILISADGEALGLSPAEVSICAQSVKVAVPETQCEDPAGDSLIPQ